MPTIAEYRERFPSLTGLSDDALIRRVAEVQGVAPDAVIAHMGYKPPKASAPRMLADVGLAGAQGVVSGVKMFSDLAGADNPVSGALESANEGLGSLMSQARQSEVQNRSRMIDEANATGDTWESVKAYMGGLIEAPFSTVAQGVGSLATMAPALLLGGAPAAGLIGGARGAAMIGLGAAQGVGAVKGSTFERVRDGLRKEGRSQEEAQAKATEAQSYLGMNATDLAVAGVIGAISGKVGAPAALEAILHGTVKGAAGKTAARMLTRGSEELTTEAAQGGQEQFAGNRALTNAGIQTDPMMGVAGASLAEGVTGGIIGAGIGVKAPRSLMQQAQADKGLSDLKAATTPDALVDAALRATDIPLLPVGEATEVPLPVDDGLEGAVRDLTAPRIPVGEVIPNIPVGEVIEPVEDIPVGDAIPLPDVIEAGGDLPLPEGMAPRTPKVTAPTPANPMTDADIVRAVVDGFRKTNTPQARAFVQDFGAGRIKPADVLKLVGRPPTTENRVEDATARLAAAAAQAPKGEPSLLLTADGQPYGTRSGAYVRAKREGLPPESIVPVTGGWVVRKESASEQPNLAGTSAIPARPGDGRGADAGRSGGNLRPDPDGAVGLDRPADAPKPGSGSAGAVAVGGEPDAALSSDIAKGQADRMRAEANGVLADHAAADWEKARANAAIKKASEIDALAEIIAATPPPAQAQEGEFIRKPTNAEIKGTTPRQRAMRDLFEQHRRSVVFKSYGAQGAGFYFAAPAPAPATSAPAAQAGDREAAAQPPQAQAGTPAAPASDQQVPLATPAPGEQDRQGMREQDRRLRDLDASASELAGQMQADALEEDFDAADAMPALQRWAADSNVPADDLRQAVIKRLNAKDVGIKANDRRKLLAALDPTKPAARAPADTAPTADPFASDYAALVGKPILEPVTIDGKSGTMKHPDAAAIMRDFDGREKALVDLKACLGRK